MNNMILCHLSYLNATTQAVWFFLLALRVCVCVTIHTRFQFSFLFAPAELFYIFHSAPPSRRKRGAVLCATWRALTHWRQTTLAGSCVFGGFVIYKRWVFFHFAIFLAPTGSRTNARSHVTDPQSFKHYRREWFAPSCSLVLVLYRVLTLAD